MLGLVEQLEDPLAAIDLGLRGGVQLGPELREGRQLTEYITSSHSQLLARIAAEKTLSDPLVAELKAAIEQFKSMHAST